MTKIKTLFLLITVSLGALKAQQFDTSGIANWPRLYNSYETWSQGAFDANRDTNNPADFGWGKYNMATHFIEGDSIYIIKTVAGNYKAVSIDQLASGTFSITYANLDGSQRVRKTLDRAPYGSKNFFYYSLDQSQVKDLEPASNNWDLVFTKYLTFFPGFGGYGVAGALHNRGVQTAQVETQSGQSAALSDTVSYPFQAEINTIGYDWKSAGPGGTVIHDTLTYFVRDQRGSINRLAFLDYGGSGNGNIKFTVNGVADSISLGAGNVNQVYYSLTNASEVSVNTDQNWDLAFFAQGSFEAIPVRINDVSGAELYVYPKADIQYWNSLSRAERKLNILSVYPNPAQNQVKIAASAQQSGELTVELYNLNGQLVKAAQRSLQSGLNETGLEVTELPRGVYLLKLKQGETVATTRLMVQ